MQRRNFIRVAIAGVSASLCSPIPAARASDKMTKARAEYRDSPNGIYSCGNCTLFVAPSSCKVVEGEVSRDGWCKVFALAD
jgi:high potential iron-sulfur protein